MAIEHSVYNCKRQSCSNAWCHLGAAVRRRAIQQDWTCLVLVSIIRTYAMSPAHDIIMFIICLPRACLSLQVVTANANGCEIYYSLFAHKLNIAPSVRGVHELRVWRAPETRVASDSAHGRDPCIIVVQYSLICTN